MKTVNVEGRLPIRIITFTRVAVSLLATTLLLSGCTVFEQHNKRFNDSDKTIDSSYLAQSQEDASDDLSSPEQAEEVGSKPGFSQLRNLPPGSSSTLVEKKELDRFSTEKELTVNVNDMPVSDFLHYAMGDLLGTNYVLDEQVKSAGPSVTLSLREATSKRELYVLVGQRARFRHRS